MDARHKAGHDGAAPCSASSTKVPEHREALDRVREWTRARFALGEDSAILVAEVACAVPGCPPLETVIAFWSGGRRHHTKVFKPVARGGRGRPAAALDEGRDRGARRFRVRLLLVRRLDSAAFTTLPHFSNSVS